MKLMKVVMENQELNNKLLIEQNKEEENKASLDGGLFLTTSSDTATMSNTSNGLYLTLQCLKKLSQIKSRKINW